MTRLNSAPNVKLMVRFHWDLATNFTLKTTEAVNFP